MNNTINKHDKQDQLLNQQENQRQKTRHEQGPGPKKSGQSPSVLHDVGPQDHEHPERRLFR